MNKDKEASTSKYWYRVSNTGYNHQLLFYNNNHRRAFLALLSRISDEFSIEIHAYCLMDNRYELLIQSEEQELSVAISDLNSAYSQQLNEFTGRHGEVFAGVSIVIPVHESDIIEVSRDIHQTPVRSTGLYQAEYYRWSSYQAYIGIATAPEWLCRDEIFKQYPPKHVYREYYDYVEGVE